MQGRRIPFRREDEEKIASAAFWGTVVAVTSIVSGVLGAIFAAVTQGIGELFGQVISLTITVLLGVWLYQASAAFRHVATTDEADERYLLEGFSKLRNYFMMSGIVIIVVLSLGVMILLGALMCAGLVKGVAG